MTVLTRLCPAGLFAAELNDIVNVSCRTDCGTLPGFAEEKMRRYFSGHICRAANALNIPAEEVWAQIKEHCGGRRFDLFGRSQVYAPRQVLRFLDAAQNGFLPY